MAMTSAAEAKLDARVRPEISAMQARIHSAQRGADGLAPVSAIPRGQDRRTPVRLTRRGRIVVGALIALGVAAAAGVIWFAVAGQAQASSHATPTVPLRGSMQRVVVRPGQTLWGIAVKADPEADPRVIIPEIVDLNAMRGTAVQVGQVLWVPRA